MRRAWIALVAIVVLVVAACFLLLWDAPDHDANAPEQRGHDNTTTTPQDTPDPDRDPAAQHPRETPWKAVTRIVLSDPEASALIRSLTCELVEPVAAPGVRSGDTGLEFALPENFRATDDLMRAKWRVRVSLKFPNGMPRGWDQDVTLKADPVVSGRTVNLGELAIDLPPRDRKYALVGRLLCAGQVLSLQRVNFAVREVTNPVFVDIRSNSDGHVYGEFEWNVDKHGQPEKAAWRVAPDFLNSGWDTWQAHQLLPPPKRVGHVLDFGDIHMEGGVVEVFVETPDGTPFIGGHLQVVLRSGTLDYFDDHPCDQQPWRGVLPHGLYWHELDIYEAALAYHEFENQFEVKLHRVTTLRYVPKPWRSITVYVQTIDGAAIDAEATTGNSRWPDSYSWQSALAPVSLQVDDEYDSHLYARAKGWKEKSVAITAHMKEAHITLDEREDPPPPPTTLKVVLPPSTWLAGHYVFARLLVRTTEGNEFWRCEGGKVAAAEETIVEFNLGDQHASRIEITGGLRFGFVGGVLAGPHDLGLTPQQPNEWRLDEWPEPPTTTPAPRRPIATCEGRRMEFNAPSRFQSGRIDVFDIGGVADSPVAVLDGSGEIPVPMVVDPAAGPQIKVDLPARIKVRRNPEHEAGEWAIYCETGASAWPGAAGESGSARAWFIDNEAWLWAPKGPVRLQVSANSRTLQTWKLEIVDDRVHTFDVDESSGDVTLEITTNNPDVRKSWFNSSWFQVMKAGTLGGHWAKPGQHLKLEPGSYVLVAPDELIADPVPFEAVAGETTVVRMKVRGEVSFDAKAILRPPVEGHVIVPQIRYTIDHLPGSPVASGRAMLFRQPQLHARQVPEGLLLHDLPRNREFWLWGAASVGEKRYALIPMKMTVGDEHPVIEGKWVQLRRGSKDWRLTDANVCWETPAGPAVWIERISAGTTWECSHPIGPARMSVRHGSQTIPFETNWEESNDPVDIPPDLASKLREAGVLP